LAHQALLYGSEEEFRAGTVPCIRNGRERGDIRVVTTDRIRVGCGRHCDRRHGPDACLGLRRAAILSDVAHDVVSRGLCFTRDTV
jgi:hypothetical protein